MPKRKTPKETPPPDLSAVMRYLGSKGGKAGTGKSKARDSQAMSAAAKKRWADKNKPAE
jgi:hypothetical protein